MNFAQPFPIIAWSLSPVFAYIGMPISITTIPGVSAVNFAVTAGSLPPGLSLDSETGTISGTPSLLMTNNVVSITGTFVDSTTYTVQLPFSILSIPVEAPASNAASQDGFLELAEYRTNIFINEVNELIAQAVQQGKFEIFASVPEICNFNVITNYFEGLNYSIQPVNWRANRYQISNPWLGSFQQYGEYSPPYYGNPYYSLIPRPGYPFLSPNGLNRVRISWNPFPIGRYAPYYY
jgi:hypothetical protein